MANCQFYLRGARSSTFLGSEIVSHGEGVDVNCRFGFILINQLDYKLMTSRFSFYHIPVNYGEVFSLYS